MWFQTVFPCCLHYSAVEGFVRRLNGSEVWSDDIDLVTAAAEKVRHKKNGLFRSNLEQAPDSNDKAVETSQEWREVFPKSPKSRNALPNLL